ncbi:MAG: DUF3089 domain-containing protein, partial [Synergistaceae bacterium]|nr:DUF3089 domain-containing protein [Synergistaceae bacterium]
MKRVRFFFGSIALLMIAIMALGCGTASGAAADPGTTPRATADWTITVKDDGSGDYNSADTMRSVGFTLTSDVDGIWKVYDVPEGGSPLRWVTAAYDAPAKKLALTAKGGSLSSGTYYLSVTSGNLRESTRLALTVAPYPVIPSPNGRTYNFQITNYAGDNWVVPPQSVYDDSSGSWGKGEAKPVDCFYILPTTYGGSGYEWSSADDAQMRTGAGRIRDSQFGIFRGANMFAPFYKQFNLTIFNSIGWYSELTKNDRISLAMENVGLLDNKAAFEYYLNTYNPGAERPIIYAGHSQGAILQRLLLKWIKYAHPEALDKMVAAYLIGHVVDQKWCDETGIPFATGATDTGVVISYNTEDEDIGETDVNSFIDTIPDGLSINPINWRRDSTPAQASESQGSFLDLDRNGVFNKYPRFTGAYIHPTRGTVIATFDVGGYDYAGNDVPVLT